MTTRKKRAVAGTPRPISTLIVLGAMFAILGALGGVVVGALAGGTGLFIGGVVGGLVGALAALPFRGREAADSAHDRKLDRDVGIGEGDIGAPNLPHRSSRGVASSAAAAGASNAAGGSGTPSEGPMPPSE